MEFELGLKIIKNKDRENHTSTDLHIAKDSAEPLFFSRETDKAFVLTAHLKGFKKERIRINISEDKTQISISGEKPVQEMVMRRWIMYKKEETFKGFRKVFRIPDGVDIDKINAKFNEKETILSISMPKTIRGIQGIGIEEVAEAETPVTPSTPPVLVEEAPETLRPELKQSVVTEVRDAVDKELPETTTPASPVERGITEPMEDQSEEIHNEQPLALPEEIKEDETIQEHEVEEPRKAELSNIETLQDVQNEIQEEKNDNDRIQTLGEDEGKTTEKKEQKPRKYRLCGTCIFAGSAFIGFIIVLVVQLIRTNNKSKKN